MIHPTISQHLFKTTLLAISSMLFSHTDERSFPPPANDNCANAMSIDISGGGFDYGTFTSQVSDVTMASGQAGEFFEFATEYSHRKSVWFEFTLVTSRSIVIKLETAPGSVLPDPKHSGLTLYSPSSCLPGANNRLGSIISSGELERYCTIAGKYRIQVTAVDDVNASFFVSLSLSCPYDPIYPEVSRYDCPDKAFVFNTGLPLPQSSSSYSGSHAIECHSIEDPTEYGCLPLPNKADYLKSSWYVFTTGNVVDLLAFDFSMGSQNGRVGYRLLEGNVRMSLFSTLPIIDCGIAKENFSRRFVEFACMLTPNTTYSLVLIFHKDFNNNELDVRALQRGMTATGWPRPILPPVVAGNQLGVLPEETTWEDRFDCSAFISDNNCPPANPASGVVVIGTGNDARSFDMATWATFSVATDVHIEFHFNFFLTTARYHTRIFSKTLDSSCPSPDPGNDLYYEFSGREGEIQCLPQGDYAIQVLSSSHDTFPSSVIHNDAWTHGSLGTRFILRFSIISLPSVGLFRLDAEDEFDAINGLAPLEHNVSYASTPAVFICANTVLPEDVRCPNIDKAIYREVHIGDYDLDGQPDEGLLCISGLQTYDGTDEDPEPPIFYQLFKGDANQLATAAGTHAAGQEIPGLIDYLNICIDDDDFTINPPGIDNFCTCVTNGIYTLASFGNVDLVGYGDSPVFNLKTLKTIHDSRENAELIAVGSVPGIYVSNHDYFSCTDNRGNMPPCGEREKLIYREFYLADSAVVTIAEIGSSSSVMSLFSGRATDLTDNLTLILDCFGGGIFIDYCTPFPPGWYTIVSYGYGPNYTNRKIWNAIGDGGDVGRTSRISIRLDIPITPNFNLPEKAYQAGITDWATPPPGNPNATTGRTYAFVPDTFCAPDTPFIANGIIPCIPEYNRIAFYVFEITKTSFVQIQNVDQSFYTEVFPFDVNAQPGALLNVPPVYPCLITSRDYRQICDLPPGKYTIAIFANDSHMGLWVAPYIYVDEAALSRFDHAWNAYDFDLVPTTNVFVDGRTFDVHPFLSGQAPSRDVFYCTTGANPPDPNETQCGTQLNPLIYAQPDGVPKPLFLNDNLVPPWAQPWRNLWYTFKLSGSGICTLRLEQLSITNDRPLIALYESDADGDIPWTTLQSMLDDTDDVILPGLKLVAEKVNQFCDAESGDIIFNKSGCIRDNVRYYVLVSFDAYRMSISPNLPNQAISLSIKYDAKPTFGAPYDERPDANVVNGLFESSPPYTSVPLGPGNTVMSTDFSLLCYTRNATDPPGCSGLSSGKSAWFKFEIFSAAQIFIALEEIGVTTNGWFAGTQDMTVWREAGGGGPLTEQLPLSLTNAGHDWLEGCIDPGTYYLLVRHCSSQIDTIQPYRVVLDLVDSPGDFCYNAIPINVNNFSPITGSALVNCHSIGTDVGEMPPAGNTCFAIAGRKTSWFHAIVNAGPMVDLKFQLGENFTSSAVDLSDVTYRILAGTCGAMTPIACSEGNINLTLDCLGTGDYYVQVSMPQKIGTNPNSPDVEGTLSLTVTATASNPETCTDPVNPNEINANFTYTSDCQSITFFNLSTAGTDITYLWEFPDDTSTSVNPIWTPPPGSSNSMITLTVTNIVSGISTSVTQIVTVSTPFAAYIPMTDTLLCNGMGSVLLNATMPGATYLWDNNSTDAQRLVSVPGIYTVLIALGACEKRDTVIVEGINATRTIDPTICPESEIAIGIEVFDRNNPTGTVIIPNAHPSGCDSILTVSLSFYADATHQLSETICAGESFLFGDSNLTETGTYQDTLVSIQGCDSLVTLLLTVTPRLTLDHVVSGCIGASLVLAPVTTGIRYEWSDGTMSDSLIVNSPGIYTVSIFDLNNCLISEETFMVAFGALSSPAVSIPEPACVGQDVLLIASGSSGEYQWFDAASGGTLLGTGTSLVLPDVQSDIIVYVQAFQVGFDTCISPRTQAQVLVIEENVQFVEIDTVICAESFITLPWGENIQPETNGSFSYVWQNSITGCDSLQLTVNVSILDMLSLSLPSTLTIQFGDSVLLEPVINFLPDSLIWLPPDGLSCSSCLQPWAQPMQSTDYTLSAWTIEGCLVTAPVRVEVNREPRIYIPNVFSPNGDEINDIFTIVANREVRIVQKFTLYDRWGGVLWEEEDFLADGTVGWDGFAGGKLMQPGVYVWRAQIEFLDGSVEVLAGDVTLLR